MTSRDDIILWLDLETTGSHDEALVLEVGMAVTGPGPEFEVLDEFSAVIRPGSFTAESIENDTVAEMHAKSGLMGAIPWGWEPHILDMEMRMWITKMFGVSKQHVVLAGSGVGHFDRKYIKRDWPWLDQRLAYYCYDVGVLRRFMRMIGVEAGIDQGLTPHRALADVRQHIKEARTLLRLARETKT